jgi:predicted CopG family antitoxin
MEIKITGASKSKTVNIYACIHRPMASKTISIRDNVYKLLKDARRENESFSDVIERLLKKDKTDLSEYLSSLKDNPLLYVLEEDSRRIRTKAIVHPCSPAKS